MLIRMFNRDTDEHIATYANPDDVARHKQRFPNDYHRRVCAHPAGCDMLAAPGDIFCEGCATDPCLAYTYGH